MYHVKLCSMEGVGCIDSQELLEDGVYVYLQHGTLILPWPMKGRGIECKRIR